MKMSESRVEINFRAAAALKAVLSEVSTLKLMELRCESAPSGRGTGFVVRVDVLGHLHTLACAVKVDVRPGNLRAALRELHESAAHVAGDATPVLIAPYLSPEAQALCKESDAGFLDLEGNARIAIGEVFVGKRTFVHRHTQPSALAAQAGYAPHSVSTSRDSAGAVAVA